jgi:hypothetical protein
MDWRYSSILSTGQSPQELGCKQLSEDDIGQSKFELRGCLKSQSHASRLSMMRIIAI